MEPQLEQYSLAMRREVEVQRRNPICILPLKHNTCSKRHAKIHPWDGTYHIPYISGVQEFVPLVVYDVMCNLAIQSTPSAELASTAL